MEYFLMIVSLIMSAIYLRKKVLIEMNVLQIHSYESDKMIEWLHGKDKVLKMEFIKEFTPLVALIPCLIANRQLSIIFSNIFLIILLFTLTKYTNNPNTKKPLVLTPRVKRMLYIVYPVLLFLLLIPILLVYLLPIKLLNILLRYIMILFILDIVALIKTSRYFIKLSNYLMRNKEAKVNEGYINEAKDIIKSMPNLKVIGITGSYGKTSTKYFVSTILSEKYAVCKTPGSYNTTLGVVRTIREVLDKDDEIFVCEMGSRHLGDIKEICDIVPPTSAIITAIGDAHLETFKTIENTKEAKFEIARGLNKKQNLYVNIDNENILQKLGSDVDKNLNNYNVVTYSLKDKDSDYYATNITYTSKGETFDCIINGDEKNKLTIHTPLLGKHNIYNTLAAIAVAKDNKLTNEEIIKGASKIKPVEHRLQILKATSQITVIDDTFNANPEGTKEALEVLNMIEGNKKIIITPGMIEMGDKEYELNYEFGENCAKKADYTIMVGEVQTKPMQDAFNKLQVSKNKYYVAKNLDDASSHLQKILELKDVVLYENDMPEDM
ncbi:MAG: UDP-N-acetylmuramoyl-tripeptide--D-alanyl-D-alanine ligase [Clostridia bacterium]|nr:UDP-N-acetylmuramoyl-tripeptide--D-alanyl-D-alanine ligase [Clostridia bacterium]